MSLNSHGNWVVRKGDGTHPGPGIPQCDFCGSITPEDFVIFCSRQDCKMEVADWKYGYPHKVYVTVPCQAPGNATHLKFYFEHLASYTGLETSTELVSTRTGLLFSVDVDRRLRYVCLDDYVDSTTRQN